MFSARKSHSLKACLFASAALLAVICAPQAAFAQIEEATRAADPGRAQQDIIELQDKPQLSPSYEVKSAILQKAPEGADKVLFVLNKLEVEGVTAYQKQELEKLYAGKIGQTVSLADVYTLSGDITNKYRNEGYILTQVYVPPQTIDGGNVKLRVVEGFVDKIAIEGETVDSEVTQVRKYAENVKMKSVLNAKDLQRNLLLINDLPGVTARTILSPSKTTVGASDMTIIVERDREEAELGFDNHGSRYLGAYQGTAIGVLNSPFGHNERIAGQFVMAGDNERMDELAFGSTSYELPISRTGTKLRLMGSYAQTRPGYDLKEFDIKGRSAFGSIGISHPCIRTRDLNLTTRGTFDFRDVHSKSNVEDTRKDRIVSARAGANLLFVDTLLEVGVNMIDFEVSHGLELIGANNDGDENLSRERGHPQYTKANLSAQRLQRVTPKVNVLVAAEAQVSADPLLSAEEFGVGGMGYGFGRGYDPSEIVGDSGIAGKIELQINKPYDVRHIHDYQLYTFLDSGKVWNRDATTSDDDESLTSVGLGIRADITEQTKAGLAVAVPLTRDIGSRDDTDTRVFFNINHQF